MELSQDITLDINGYEVQVCVSGQYFRGLQPSYDGLIPGEESTFELETVKPYKKKDTLRIVSDITAMLPDELLTEIENEILEGME